MKKFYTLYICAAAIFLAGCTAEEAPTPEPVADLVDVAYEYTGKPVAWRDSVLKADQAAIDALLKVVGDSTLEEWAQSRAVAVFSPDVQAVFPTPAEVGLNLGFSLKEAECRGITLPTRTYATVVYGRPESIMFVDSVMLVALNHFLGADYPGYAGMPEYMRQTKTPGQLPYAMAEALVGMQCPYAVEQGGTLLSRMLYEGALIRAKMLLVKASKPWDALGYDADTYKEVTKSEREIWEAMVQSRLIFDTSESAIDRICAPAPFVRIEAAEWPGRIGRFIGWRIVEAFVKNNPDDSSLPYLLSPDFYESDRTLEKAGY